MLRIVAWPAQRARMFAIFNWAYTLTPCAHAHAAPMYFRSARLETAVGARQRTAGSTAILPSAVNRRDLARASE